jgi:hypothetical protein
MVVLEVQVDDVLAVNPECHSPVAGDIEAPGALRSPVSRCASEGRTTLLGLASPRGMSASCGVCPPCPHRDPSLCSLRTSGAGLVRDAPYPHMNTVTLRNTVVEETGLLNPPSWRHCGDASPQMGGYPVQVVGKDDLAGEMELAAAPGRCETVSHLSAMTYAS